MPNMQQTGLNLLAIGVFVMTLSVLFGPLLNISPIIPAVTTIGIMGLVTVDTFSWQNKGITLLLDCFASPQQRKRIIHHEAGHFLTAYFLGIPITGYTLTAWEAWQQKHPGLGGVQFDTEVLSEQAVNIQEMPLILERLGTVLMGGIAAEMLVYQGVEGGEDDRQKLQGFLNLANLPTSSYQQKEKWALLQAKNLLEKYHNSYQALVEAMEKRDSIEDCYQVIQENIIVGNVDLA